MHVGVFRRIFGFILDAIIIGVIIWMLRSVVELFILQPKTIEFDYGPWGGWGIYSNWGNFLGDYYYAMVWGDALNTILSAIVFVLYFSLTSYFRGGLTIGKQVMGIQVVSTNTSSLTFNQVLLRELLGKYVWWVFTMGFGVVTDVLMASIRRDGKTIRDIVFNTDVVYSELDG